MWTVLMECRSFQELGESTLHSKNGCGQFYIASTIDMRKASSCPECGMEGFPAHQYGETFEVSERGKLELTLTSSAAGSHSHVKTSVLQDLEKAWVESEVDFSSRSCGWPKKSSQSSFSLRTSPQLELGGSSMWPKGLPVPAMIVDGILYPLRKLARLTKELDGSALPTPTAQSYGTNKGGAAGRKGKARPSLETMAKSGLWPTPRASANENRQTKPTPSQLAGKHGMNLATAVNMLPTPRASEASRGDSPSERRRKTPGLESVVNMALGTYRGQLNPTWVEWLMGYPIEWTVCADWATPSSQRKPKKLSKG